MLAVSTPWMATRSARQEGKRDKLKTEQDEQVVQRNFSFPAVMWCEFWHSAVAVISRFRRAARWSQVVANVVANSITKDDCEAQPKVVGHEDKHEEVGQNKRDNLEGRLDKKVFTTQAGVKHRER